MSITTFQLRVTSVRSRGTCGGVIFSGVTDAQERYVAVCDYSVINDASIVDKGQHWSISGTVVAWNDERQIKAASAHLMRPSGRNIVEWIANSTLCAGIGHVKAAKLYAHFGPDLIEHINTKNVAKLTEVLSPQAADLLCHAFEQHNIASTLLWLDRIGINRRIGQKIANFYGADAQAKIEANPYRLVSFSEKWKAVDDLARNRLGIKDEDRRRIEAAIEQVLYDGVKNGHTCLPSSDVKSQLYNLLNSALLAKKALALDNGTTQYIRVGDFYQPAGTYIIETYVATRLREIACGEDGGQRSLLADNEVDEDTIDRSIAEYEADQGFQLTAEQRDAVIASAGSHLSLILGGAGTGKTTVLKALYRALETSQPGIGIYQLALAGRAAQRMSEATGRESMTIAAFLNKIDPSMLGHGSVIVVDEGSMVDVILMYRLLRHIPPGAQLILLGDPSQLPPIGPGLVLHALAGHPSVVQTELKVTKRQSSASGIPAVAGAIRAHQIPEFGKYTGKGSGVSFVSCADTELDETALRIYEELNGDGSDYRVQILSTTRNSIGGVRGLNAALHYKYHQELDQVQCYDSQFGVVGAITLEKVPLHVGDLVMFTENDYLLGLRNGSLGVILEALPVTDEASDCCRAEFDGTEYILKTSQIYALTHAYAITIHKSQGSQFERVIIPIRQSRLLDQTLIYTAVTRGVEQVVFVGDLRAARNAIVAPAAATRRHVTLPKLLNSEWHLK